MVSVIGLAELPDPKKIQRTGKTDPAALNKDTQWSTSPQSNKAKHEEMIRYQTQAA